MKKPKGMLSNLFTLIFLIGLIWVLWTVWRGCKTGTDYNLPSASDSLSSTDSLVR